MDVITWQFGENTQKLMEYLEYVDDQGTHKKKLPSRDSIHFKLFEGPLVDKVSDLVPSIIESPTCEKTKQIFEAFSLLPVFYVLKGKKGKKVDAKKMYFTVASSEKRRNQNTYVLVHKLVIVDKPHVYGNKMVCAIKDSKSKSPTDVLDDPIQQALNKDPEVQFKDALFYSASRVIDYLSRFYQDKNLLKKSFFIRFFNYRANLAKSKKAFRREMVIVRVAGYMVEIAFAITSCALLMIGRVCLNHLRHVQAK